MNCIKTGLSLINSVAKNSNKSIKQCSKVVSSPLFENKATTIADDIGIDTIKLSKKTQKTISPAEFKANYCKSVDDELQIFPFEEKKVTQIAQKADGNYDKEILDCIIDLRKKGLEKGDRLDYASSMTELLLHDGKIDKEMKQKLISIIEKTENYDNLNGFFYKFNSISPIPYEFTVKKEILEFLHSTPEILSRGYERGETSAKIIRKALNGDLNKQDVQKRLNHIKAMYKTLAEDDSICNVDYLLDDLGKENFNKFIDSGLIPNSQFCEYFENHADDVLKAIKPFQNKGIQTFAIEDASMLDVLLTENNSPLKKIITTIPDNKYSHFEYVTSSLDDTRGILSMQSSKDGFWITFDKNTNEVISVNERNFTNLGFQQKTKFMSDNKEVMQKYRWQEETVPQLKYEKIKSGGEEIYYTEANIPGQADVFRVKDGKVEVLSRGFRDPISGETVIKRNFSSHSGIKTNYNYSSQNNGSYTLDNVIKDKNGKVLMNNHRNVEKLGENHFRHTINGKKYDVMIKGNTVKITEQNGKQTFLDLNEYVFEGELNDKILDTLRQMPPDELLKFKNIKNLKFLLSKEGSQCVYDYKLTLDSFKHIDIFDENADDMFTYLHELGHLKRYTLDTKSLDNIKKVYAKEVELYKAKTRGYSIGTMDYLIDNTEHYLNDDIGALAEVIADVNAHLKYPNNDPDLAERTVKFMEEFPETIAEIAKYL